MDGAAGGVPVARDAAGFGGAGFGGAAVAEGSAFVALAAGVVDPPEGFLTWPGTGTWVMPIALTAPIAFTAALLIAAAVTDGLCLAACCFSCASRRSTILAAAAIRRSALWAVYATFVRCSKCLSVS